MKMRTLLLSTGLMLLVAMVWADMAPGEVDEDCSLASDLVTPHKDWGKGLAGGPVRALFFVYTGAYDGTWEDMGSRVRQIVELTERFDMQADAVLYCGSGDKWFFHGLKDGEDRAERLLQKPYQLYVLAGIPMEKLPAKFQYLILKQVTAGAGLLYCGPGSSEYMTDKRQITPTPPALVDGLPILDKSKPADVIKAYKLAGGRGAWITYASSSLTPDRQFSYAALHDYDYWLLWVGRAALWAASRDGDLGLAAILGGEPLTIKQTAAQTTAGVVVSNRGTSAASVKASLELCRLPEGVRLGLGEQAATVPAGGTTRLTVLLPRLRAGEYLLDAVVRDNGGVRVSGAGNLRVESDVGIDRVEMSARFAEVGDAITGKVTLRGSPPAGSAVRLCLRDSYDRVIQQQDTKLLATQTELSFSYRPDRLFTSLMRVEATLVVGGQQVETKDASFTVPKRRHGQFNLVMWDIATDPLGYYAWRQMQQAGISTCLFGSMGAEPTPQPGVLAACDASLVPYSTRILDPKDENGYMQPVCWNDDPKAAEYVQKIVDNQKLLRELGVFVYSLGDEGVTLGCSVDPADIAAYRRWLGTQYETIDKLNASWGTTYKSFGEVDLLDHKDNMEAASIRTSFPRWCDRQLFARYNLMQFSGRFVDDYSKLDPQALTGFEGTGGFGDDYDAICGINGFYGPYPDLGDDLVRSIYPTDRIHSNWMGYSKTGDALSDAAWRMVTKGMNACFYWMWSGIGSWRGYTRPTFDFWPAIQDLANEMKPVREGLGDLLLNSKMIHSGIGIFYSVPLALSSQIEDSPQFIDARQTHDLWSQLTFELGLDYRYVTSGTLKHGALAGKEFKLLVLAMAQAMSPEEAAEIRKFVEAGGTVVADVRPGIFDAHCKPVTPGVLDDLFGIKRTGRGGPTEASLVLKTSLDGKPLDTTLTKVRVDTGVEAMAAQPLGMADKTPVLLVNRVGAGRAILLNFQIAPSKPTDDATESVRKLLRFVYAVCGARSAVDIAGPKGDAMPNTEARQWQNGDAVVCGLWRHMENAWFGPKSGTTGGAPQPARLTFASPRYVYDLRARKALGKVARVDTSLRWGRANYFLALPYPIKGLEVAVSSTIPAAGQYLNANVSLDLPAGAKERFAVWVEVFNPRGEQPLWGRQVVVLSGGKAQVPMRVAFNDTPGKWRVRVTELFSNQTAEASWTVQ